MSTPQTYLQWLRLQHRYSENTLKAVERDLQWLCAALQSPRESELRSDVNWQRVSADQVRGALSRARAEGLSAATLARMASSCRGFFSFLEEQGVLTIDLMQGVRTPRKPRRLPKALSPDEALQLLQTDASRQDDELNASDLKQAAVLAELLYGSGLRISEAVGLDRTEQAWLARCKNTAVLGGWFDVASGQLHIVGKGGKPRVVPLTSAAQRALLDFIGDALAWPAGFSERPVFVNRRGYRLSVRSAQRMLAQLAALSGLERHVHPHMLRHSFASHVLQSSGDLRAVQELMGHASIASTQVYTSLDFQHLSAVYDKAHPRAKAKRS